MVVVVIKGKRGASETLLERQRRLAQADASKRLFERTAALQQQDERIEGQQLLHVSQTVPHRLDATELDYCESDPLNRPKRQIYQTTPSRNSVRGGHGKRYK